MSLWNIIRDFFVQYIFGGADSTGEYFASYVGFGADQNANYNELFTNDFYLPVNGFYGGNDNGILWITIGDWLSTTATIITLCAICVFLFFFVRWLFRLTAGLLSGRG